MSDVRGFGGNEAASINATSRRRRAHRLAVLAGLVTLGLATSAPALVITGGPVYGLPGGGSCTVSGDPSKGTGATISCTGVNLSAHSNVYFGIRNDTNVNGNSMTGATPSGAAVFGFSSSGATSITYASSTTVNNALVSPTQAVTSTLILSSTAGSTSVVATGGTPADNGNGQIQRLFKLTSGTNFTFTALINASSSSFSGVTNPGVYDPTHTPASGASDISKVDVAFYYSDCGDGVTDSPAEQCDLGAGNGLSTTCCTSACQFRASGLICRTAAGVCDAADTCSGSSANCPADGKSTALCRASAGACDVAEFCNGVGNNCPNDAKSTAQCRASAGACDPAETCDGVNDNCPADAKSTNVCRAAGGVCDGAETCDGLGNDCPADAKTTAQCRNAAGVCDVAEFCDGVNNACPTDAFVPSSTECRASAGVCDVAENCTGSSANCPADGKSTAQCRASAGVCDVADVCDGVADDCPADGKSTAQCRAAAGVCDAVEVCDGVGNDCPADVPQSAGTECRAVAGVCDVAEQCDGVSNDCPVDGFASGTECRAATDVCDVAESCTGSSADCPADGFAPSTVVCRAATAGEVCDVDEMCTGSSAACPPNGGLPDGTPCDDTTFCNGVQTCSGNVCGGGTDPCSMGESCDEATDSCFIGSCPPSAVACRPADKTKLLIKNKTDDTKDKIIWKWAKGADTTQGEFADPRNSAQYALCFYAGPTSSLLKQIGVPPSASKWSAVGTKGFKYNDIAGTADGITKIIVKGGILGKSKAIVKGKGSTLPDFDADLPIAMGDLPLIVQLRNNETGICWEAQFSLPKKNQTDQFNAKTP